MTNPQLITDKDITLIIEEELAQDEGISAHLVDVDTQNGIVVLTGTVDNILAMDRALEVIEHIRGVRAVVNQLKVKPVVRSSQEIQQDVLKALMLDASTRQYKVNVRVKEGVVTLTGSVSSWDRKQLVDWVARGIKGVRAVQNDIQIEYIATRSDDEIHKDIERRLERDARIDEAEIKVGVNLGVATLQGAVPSTVEKRWAIYDAWVDGVTAVLADQLTIPHFQPEQKRWKGKQFAPSDEALQQAIRDAFRYDPRIHTLPQVEVRQGLVVLTGVVNSLLAKKAATLDARNTVGVWRIKNFLKVRPEHRPDDIELANNVRLILLGHPDIDRHQIIVSCHNGKIRLYGQVDSNYEKNQAEEVASRMQGVIEVENHLRVDQTIRWRSDREIQQDIETRYQWDTAVSEDQIAVTVKEGIATVTGTASSWYEHHKMLDNALKAGAKNVISQVQIRQSG